MEADFSGMARRRQIKKDDSALYDQLGGSIMDIFEFAKKNNIDLPNEVRIYSLVDEAENIIDSLNTP